MANLIKEARFSKSDAANNNNKYWYIELYDDASYITRFGRVGGNGDSDRKQFPSQDAAERGYEAKVREKLSPRKGYTQLKVVLGKEEVQVSGNLTLEAVALDQIASNSSETAKLIRYLSKKNIHNIVSSTTIEYDASKGTFSTPCGIVTQDGIDEARELLSELAPYVEAKDHSNKAFIKLLESYMRIIPRKIGRKFIPAEIIPNMESVAKESQILDALSASLQQVMSSDDSVKNTDAPKVFDVTVDVVDDKKVIDHITKFFNKTRNSMHTSSNLKVKKVYAVKIAHMNTAFTEKGEKIGNIMELWHGTRVENVLSILKGGLIIPKSSAGHVTGRMFGDGVYFSDQSTKSLNYSQGYWGHGSRDNNCFMFLANVAMGKYYVPSSSDSRLHEKVRKMGYDSTFAQAHKSSVMNNEMIVYDLAQCNLTYLVEFSD